MFAAIVTLALTPTSNDANWVSFGGAGAFAPHKTVQMLGEDINIKVYDDKMHVRVFFSFENRGPATTVKMAFPFSTTNWNQDLVRSFSSKVDGKAAAIERLKNVPLGTGEFVIAADEWRRNEIFVKTVEFAQGQRRTVLVDYTTGRGYAGDGSLNDSYILQTGATWAGTIGTITISVDWSNTKATSRPDCVFRGMEIKPVPQQWQAVGRHRLTTTITDVEPTFDLDLSSVGGFFEVWMDGERLDSSYGAVGTYGHVLAGQRDDPLVLIYGLDKLMRNWAHREGVQRKDSWVYPRVVERTQGTHTIILWNGKTITLRRGFVDHKQMAVTAPEEDNYLYLKDFITAIGGTFKWDSDEERVLLTLPPKMK